MALAASTCLTPTPAVHAQEIDEAKALKVKAAYLYNFTKFVRWPKSAFENNNAPFVVGLLGHDPIERALADTLRAKHVAKHPIRFRRFRRDREQDRIELQDCHVVFISESQRLRLDEVLTVLRGQPVLVVSDIHDFARNGGMIGLVLEQGRIRFEINRYALKRAKLKASAKLLNLARIVEPRAHHAADSRSAAGQP